ARKWQPYRNGDQFNPAEATQSQEFWGSLGPLLKWNYIINPKMTADLSLGRGGNWNRYGEVKWSDDVRRTDLTTGPNRCAALDGSNSRSQRWQWNGAWSWVEGIGGRNHEIKSGFMGWWNKNYGETPGYINQQLYRYRSIAGDANYFFRPDSVQV